MTEILGAATSPMGDSDEEIKWRLDGRLKTAKNTEVS